MYDSYYFSDAKLVDLATGWNTEDRNLDLYKENNFKLKIKRILRGIRVCKTVSV